MPAVVGMAVFTHFWYWHPLIHFVSLSFTPTALIGLNAELKMPKFTFISNAKPSAFAYPEPMKFEKKEAVKITSAVLSTASRRSGATKEKKEEETKDMEVDEETKKEKKEEEPTFQLLPNPSRVLLSQEKFIEFDKEGRYKPIQLSKTSGIVLLYDNTPGEEEELITPSTRSTTTSNTDVPAEDEMDPEPPAPFEYVEE